MPKLPMDYSKSIIYKIEHIENDNLVYVGHTTNWDHRKYCHKSNCYNHKGKRFNFKLYQMIRENGGWEKFKMIEVEKYPCNDKREAVKRECEVMKELNSNMNMRPSYVSEGEKKRYRLEYFLTNKEKKKEYYEENKDEIKKFQNEYYILNKEVLNKKQKQYNIENNDHIKKYKT